MDNLNKLKAFGFLSLITASTLLLGGCAQPTSVAPSYALKEQLQELKQQQAENRQQLETMQELLTQLQQQLAAKPSSGVTHSEVAMANILPTEIEQTSGETPASSPLPLTGAPDIVEVAESAATYLSAFSSLASGQYFAAETGFNQFLTDFPDHQYAPNARFWLANAQAAQNKTSQAVANLRRIVADPAGQEKAPAALVQLIQIYRRTGLTTQADAATEQLRNSFTDTTEARLFFQNESTLN